VITLQGERVKMRLNAVHMRVLHGGESETFDMQTEKEGVCVTGNGILSMTTEPVVLPITTRCVSARSSHATLSHRPWNG
jgi:hypothetical protein